MTEDSIRCYCENEYPICNGNHTGICEISGEGKACIYHIYENGNGTLVVDRGCDYDRNCMYYESIRGSSHYCCQDDLCNKFAPNGSFPTSTASVAPSTEASRSSMSTLATTQPSVMNNNYAAGIGSVVAIFFIFIAMVAAFTCKCKRRRFCDRGSIASISQKTMPVSVPIDQPRVTLATRRPQPTIHSGGRGMAADIKLIKIIGEGAFGTVWYGTYMNDPVAVKIFKSQIAASFEKEKSIYYRSIMMSAHENILGLKGCDKRYNPEIREEELWLITEYCPLGSLHHFLDVQPVGNVNTCIRLCYDICAGLAYLHKGIPMLDDGIKRSIAHRDLKPANIFLRQRGDGSVMCVIGDFGFAVCSKDLETTDNASCVLGNEAEEGCELTQRVLVGTFRYMAPEVLAKTINRRDLEKFKASDVYSLGVVMWEIGMRTKVGKIAWENHMLPFSDMILHPDWKNMTKIVHIDQRRPRFPEFWTSSDEMRILSDIIEECWRQIPERRLSSVGAKYRVADLLRHKSLDADSVPPVTKKEFMSV